MSNNNSPKPEVVQGIPIDNDELDFQDINQRANDQEIPVQMIEIDEISTEGLFCLIVGCILCPGFNLLGFCMRERRLVPANSVEYIY
jgi:hypothetical protein